MYARGTYFVGVDGDWNSLGRLGLGYLWDCVVRDGRMDGRKDGWMDGVCEVDLPVVKVRCPSARTPPAFAVRSIIQDDLSETVKRSGNASARASRGIANVRVT